MAGANQANSTAYTALRPIPKGISTRLKLTRVSGYRNSSIRASALCRAATRAYSGLSGANGLHRRAVSRLFFCIDEVIEWKMFFAAMRFLRTDTRARTLSRRLHSVLPFAIVAINHRGREDFAMTRWATLAIGFLAFCSCPMTSLAQAQSGEGWITLFDGKNLDHWQGDGNANFAIEEGAIVAKDKKDPKATAFLISKDKYKDFQVYAEFW